MTSINACLRPRTRTGTAARFQRVQVRRVCVYVCAVFQCGRVCSSCCYGPLCRWSMQLLAVGAIFPRFSLFIVCVFLESSDARSLRSISFSSWYKHHDDIQLEPSSTLPLPPPLVDSSLVVSAPVWRCFRGNECETPQENIGPLKILLER